MIFRPSSSSNIILHKNDFQKDLEKCDTGLLDKIKVKRVEEYKAKLISEAKESSEKELKDKELEEQQQMTQGNVNDKNKNNKAQPPKVVKKPQDKNKDKEPQIELVEGIPKERYDELELKEKDYSDNFKIEN